MGVEPCTVTIHISGIIHHKDGNQPTSRSSYSILGHRDKGCFKQLQRKIFKCVHYCSVHISQILEVTYMSANVGTDEDNVLHLYSGIVCNH